jgi:hypothetical protein
MLKSRIVQCLAVFLMAGCTGVATPTPVSTQEAQEVGAPCDVLDNGTDTCNPDVTGLCCCTPGPSTHGFCVDTCPAPCD